MRLREKTTRIQRDPIKQKYNKWKNVTSNNVTSGKNVQTHILIQNYYYQ